jgi:hypothetical protein
MIKQKYVQELERYNCNPPSLPFLMHFSFLKLPEKSFKRDESKKAEEA